MAVTRKLFIVPTLLSLLLAPSLRSSADSVPDEILIGLTKPGFAAPQRKTIDKLNVLGVVKGSSPEILAANIKLHAGIKMADALAELRNSPDITYAEPNHIRKTTTVPNDTNWGLQWGPQKIQADLAWDVWNPVVGPPTVVAVVDTGVQANHPDLVDSLVPGYNVIAPGTPPNDGHSHGTHCAGIVAARINNATGIAGIAGWSTLVGRTLPDARNAVKVMPVKVLADNGSGSDSQVANGIIWAANNGAKIISMSLGGPDTSTTLDNAIAYAWGRGCLVVCAAGNSATNVKFYPAASPFAMAVASTESNDTYSSFSNYGTWVHTAAPGGNILSTVPTSAYGYKSGTSMATPHVAGVAALVAAQNPAYTNAELFQVVVNNTNPATGRTIMPGGGRINALLAVQTAPTPPAAPAALTISGSAPSVTLAWNWTIGANSYTVRRSLVRGGSPAGVYTDRVVSGITGTSFVDNTVVAGTAYYYVVTATNRAGEGARSNEVNIGAPTPTNSAVYLGTDTTNRGTWRGVYGVDGYSIVNNAASIPTYAQFSVTGAQTWTWSGSSSDTRALQKPAPATDRIAACWYQGTQFTMSLNLTDGVAHDVSFYMLDWDIQARTALIEIIDADTNVVLNSQSYSGFSNGAYGRYRLRGNLRVRITRSAGPNVVMSGVFFDTPGGSVPQPPPAPTNLAATASGTTISLSWTASQGATTYNLKRGSSVSGPFTTIQSGISSTSATDAGLANGTQYFYVVTASNAGGESGNSNVANATTVPSAPANLAATANGTTIALTWTATTGATTYTVKRGNAQAGPFTTIASGVTATNYNNAGLANGTRFFYVVTATNSAGESGNSNVANATTIPAAPTGLTATASGTTISLSWTASPGATSYNLKRGSSASGPFSTIQSGLTSTSATDSGLANGTQFFYVVTAVNGAGESGNSNVADATTVPAAPTNLAATANGTTISLSWTASTGATSYNLKRGSSASGPFTTIQSGLTSTSATDSGLANGTQFFYVVTAVNGAGESGNSNVANATTAPLPPAAPTNLAAAANGTTISLNWTASSSATSYTLKRGSSASGPFTTIQSGITSTSATDAGLATGTPYFYVVTASNPGGESGNSNVASATTVPAAPTSLTAAANGTTISLSWTTSPGATSYNLKRGTSASGPFTTIQSGITGITATDAGLPNATQFFYVVTAVNGAGESGNSNVANATTAPASNQTFATFLGADTGTRGSWRGVYGVDGYSIANNSAALPAYAQFSMTGNLSWTWNGSTSDTRALQKPAPATDRIAACWYTSSQALTMNLNLTDGLAHNVSLYVLDWDFNGRTQLIEIFDAATNLLLSSQSVSGFSNGSHMRWQIRGNVRIRVTRTGGPNAVVSGVFFDTP